MGFNQIQVTCVIGKHNRRAWILEAAVVAAPPFPDLVDSQLTSVALPEGTGAVLRIRLGARAWIYNSGGVHTLTLLATDCTGSVGRPCTALQSWVEHMGAITSGPGWPLRQGGLGLYENNACLLHGMYT